MSGEKRKEKTYFQRSICLSKSQVDYLDERSELFKTTRSEYIRQMIDTERNSCLVRFVSGLVCRFRKVGVKCQE